MFYRKIEIKDEMDTQEKKIRKVIKRGDDTLVVSQGEDLSSAHIPMVKGAITKVIPPKTDLINEVPFDDINLFLAKYYQIPLDIPVIAQDVSEPKIIHTLQHDVKGVLPSINMIGEKDKPINLIGDKGYLLNKNMKDQLNRLNVKMIAPTRKNQKKKNTKKEKRKLKKRYKVENMIAKIKKFSRIHVRKDKKLSTFMGFIYIGFIVIHNER